MTADVRELLGDLAVLTARIEADEKRILATAETRLEALPSDPRESAEIKLLKAVIERSRAALSG